MKRILSILVICLCTFACKRPEPALLFCQKDLGAEPVNVSVQGTAVFGDFLFSMRDKGGCAVFDLSRKELVASFNLGSAGPMNHANDAFFSNQYYEEGDRFPLLYVSQCRNEPARVPGHAECDSLSRLLFVERVICDSEGKPASSVLVQAISYRPEKWNSRLFAFDPSAPDRIYCYGNIVGNAKPGNRIIVETFPFPAPDREHFLVTIDPASCIDRFYVDEALPEGHRGPQDNVLQGACARNGLLYLPVGVGRPEVPSELFIIDLKRRDKAGKPYRYFHADYTDVIPCEMEDVDFRGGESLICTTNDRSRTWPVYSFPAGRFRLVSR